MRDPNHEAKFLENKRTCAQAIPFFGKALQTPYARSFASGSYLGLKDAGVYCNAPFRIAPFYFGEME